MTHVQRDNRNRATEEGARAIALLQVNADQVQRGLYKYDYVSPYRCACVPLSSCTPPPGQELAEVSLRSQISVSPLALSLLHPLAVSLPPVKALETHHSSRASDERRASE